MSFYYYYYYFIIFIIIIITIIIIIKLFKCMVITVIRSGALLSVQYLLKVKLTCSLYLNLDP